MEFDTTLMTDEDKEAVAQAKREGFIFPAYRCTRHRSDGSSYTYESFFKPVQFRLITEIPFPECANLENCMRLVENWNKAGAGAFKYELISNE
jgi:hypothetical protein